MDLLVRFRKKRNYWSHFTSGCFYYFKLVLLWWNDGNFWNQGFKIWLHWVNFIIIVNADFSRITNCGRCRTFNSWFRGKFWFLKALFFSLFWHDGTNWESWTMAICKSERHNGRSFVQWERQQHELLPMTSM